MEVFLKQKGGISYYNGLTAKQMFLTIRNEILPLGSTLKRIEIIPVGKKYSVLIHFTYR